MPIQSAILPLKWDLNTGILVGAPLEIPKGFLHQIELSTVQGTLLPIGSSLSLKILSPADGTVLQNITVWNRNATRNIYEASLDTVSGILAVVGSPVIKARVDWTPAGGDPQVGKIVHVNYVRGMKTIGDTVPDYLLRLAENIRFSWKQLRDPPEVGNADNVAVTPFTGMTADRVQDALELIFAAALAADGKAELRALKNLSNADDESVLDRHLSPPIKTQLAARSLQIVGQWDASDETWPVDTTGDMSAFTPNVSAWANQVTHEWGGVTYPQGGQIVWNGGTVGGSAADFTHIPPAEFDVSMIPEASLERKTLSPVLSEQIPETWDRPDADPVVLVDANGRVILGIPQHQALESLSDEVDFDRPDLLLAIVSIDGRVIFSYPSPVSAADPSPTEPSSGVQYSNPVWWEPPAQAARSYDGDPDTVYAMWDALVSAQSTGYTGEKWITRNLLGTSSVGDYPVYSYVFEPPAPDKTIIVFCGVHGGEIYAPLQMSSFFGAVAEHWRTDPLMEYLRWSVRWVVVPLANPEGYTRLSRATWETAPFPVSWTRSGSAVTITINPEDFPDTDGRVVASGYIGPDVVGKLYVTVSASSDTDTLPDGRHDLVSADGVYSFVVTGVDAGAASGTCDMQVEADINRNVSSGWDAYSDSWVGFAANKGTKPFSTAEAIILRDLLEEESGAVAMLDLHNGPAQPYLHYRTSGLGVDFAALDVLVNRYKQIQPEQVAVVGSTTPSWAREAATVHAQHACTVEAGGTTMDATDVLRWFGNNLTAISTNITAKIGTE